MPTTTAKPMHVNDALNQLTSAVLRLLGAERSEPHAERRKMPDFGTMDVPATRAQFALWLRTIVLADAWLDACVSPAYQDQPLAHTCMRVTKVCAEAGEVMDAFSAWTGENPRKGICGTREDLLMELGDVAMAALCGIQHITKDIGQTTAALDAAIAKVRHRIDDQSAAPVGDITAAFLPPGEDGQAARVAAFRDQVTALAGDRLTPGTITSITELYAAGTGELADQNQRYRDAIGEYENAITWNTTCVMCARLLDAVYAETCRAETAEGTIAAMTAVIRSGAADPAELGKLVRAVWVAWAVRQPDAKASWLTGWDDLDAGQREVDILIGQALAAAGRAATLAPVPASSAAHPEATQL